MRGATRHATGGNGGGGYTFFFSLYEHIDFTLLTLPRVFFFLIAFNDNTWIG